MKKKIIYGLLFAVAMVTASSSFVSCKDYEGDDYARLQEEIALNGNYDNLSLQRIIELQIKRLRYELTNAYGNSNNNNYSNADIDKWLNQLNTIEDKYKSASSISDLINVLGSLNQLASEAAVVNESLKNIRYAWGDSLKKAYDKAFEAYWFAYRDSIRIDTLSNRVDSLHKNALDSARYYYVLAQEFAKKQDSIVLDSLNNVADRIYKRIQEHSDSLKQLQSALNDSCNDIRSWVAQLLTGSGTIKKAKLDDKGNPVTDEQGNIIYEEEQVDVANMQELLDALSDAVLSAQGVSEELKKDFEEALKQAEKDLQDEFNTSLNDAKIDLQNMFNEAVGKLQDQLNDLVKRVAKLEENYDKLKNSLAKLITGVVIQGTYSPVFGYGSLPLGIQTNILAAYAGKAVADATFPSYGKDNTVGDKAIITGEDYDFISGLGLWPAEETITANQIMINEKEGNAGKMYLTVNPTNVDFSGTDFKLVNSKGYESRIKLSTLEASDEVLTFGWTRGTTVGTASDNGFYEVTATISKDDALNMQPRVDKAGFKEAVMEATDCQTCTSVKQVARALYNSLQPVDRFGVKAEWIDPEVGDRSVTSAYDIAAMTINPLGFGFRIPGKALTLPTISKVIADELHINFTIEPIVITEYDKATGKYIFEVVVDAKELNLDLINDATKYAGYKTTYRVWHDKNDNKVIDDGEWESVDVVDVKKLINDIQKDTKIKAYVDLTSKFEELYGVINAKFVNFNKATADLNKQIDNIAAKVNSYIDRANNWISRIQNLLDNVGNAVQPVLIWCDGEKAGELGGFASANYAVGTVVPKDGELALIPTSYSLELFAPAYKKSLIVTNAYKGGFTAQSSAGKATGLEDAVKALNEDIKAKGFDVFSGTSLKNQYIFKAKGYEGITFEIAYTAMDYEGKIAGRKFYITVGE